MRCWGKGYGFSSIPLNKGKVLHSGHKTLQFYTPIGAKPAPGSTAWRLLLGYKTARHLSAAVAEIQFIPTQVYPHGTFLLHGPAHVFVVFQTACFDRSACARDKFTPDTHGFSARNHAIAGRLLTHVGNGILFCCGIVGPFTIHVGFDVIGRIAPIGNSQTSGYRLHNTAHIGFVLGHFIIDNILCLDGACTCPKKTKQILIISYYY